MTLDDLLAFIDEQDRALRKGKEGKSAGRERALLRITKLTEEVGELAEEVLGHHGYQRADKLAKRHPDGLGDEIADVIIVAFLLAKSVGVDAPAAIERKIGKIRARKG